MMSAAYLRRHRITVPAQLRSFTPDEAAAETGMTLYELRRLRESGEGPAYVTVGKRTVRYIRVDIDDWKRGAAFELTLSSERERQGPALS